MVRGSRKAGRREVPARRTIGSARPRSPPPTNTRGDVTVGYELVGAVLALLVLIIGYNVLSKFGGAVSGGGKEQAITENLASLAVELQKMADNPDPVAAVEKFPFYLGDQGHALIGFDAGGRDVTTIGIGCYTARRKPAVCGSKACICLFDNTMNPSPGDDIEQNTKGLVLCRKIEKIATISAIHEEHPESALQHQGPAYFGQNLGDTRKTKPLIKSIPIPLQATDHLILKNPDPYSFGLSCKTSDISVVSRYNNNPLYLERTTLDGKSEGSAHEGGTRHLVISPAGESSARRLAAVKALIGITTQTVQAKLARSDLTGAIMDTKAWLEAHPRGSTGGPSSGADQRETDTAAMLALQGQGFSRISQLDEKTASILLERLDEKPRITTQAGKHAGMQALRIYKTAIETGGRLTDDQQATIILDGLTLSGRLKGYLPEIEQDYLPYFQEKAKTVKGGSEQAAFLAARQAAITNAPDAEEKLTAFVQANPDDDQTKEARYLLAQVEENHDKIPEAVAAYQQILARHPPEPQAMPDGRIITARDEIERICAQKIADSDIFELCKQVQPSSACPPLTLALLPQDACAENLVKENRCAALPQTVQGFIKAQRLAAAAGKTLIVTSAYRSIELQTKLHNDKDKAHETAKPSCAAPHVTGGAIDVTFKGEDMGPGPDDSVSAPNRKALEDIMCQSGFTRYKGEYWHYEIGTKRATAHPAQFPGICSA